MPMRHRIVARCLSSRWIRRTRFISLAGCSRLMGALQDGRSDLRAHARRPHGLQMAGGCTSARSLEAARTSGARSFRTVPPEQITFGPTEEEGIALAPDGRSLVTSIGMRRSAIWIHDAAGERALSSEGYGGEPRLSQDGTRVFYLVARDWKLSSAGWTARVVRIARGGSRLWENRQCAAGRIRERLRCFSRREGSRPSRRRKRMDYRRFGWPRSTDGRHLA